VNAYLGWFGPASRAMQVMSAGTSVAMKVPGVEKLWSSAGERFVQGPPPGGRPAALAGLHVMLRGELRGRDSEEVDT
jgi:hypothetical protein